MGINKDNMDPSLNNSESKPNKFTDEEHNNIQSKVYRQLDLLELIKMIEEEENEKRNIQGDKTEG